MPAVPRTALERLNPDDLVRLLEALRQMGHARDIGEVTALALAAAREVTGADGVTFVLRDGDSCLCTAEDAIAPLWKGQRFPAEGCVAGWTMLNRASAVIEDIHADPRVPLDRYRPTFVKSLATVPIRISDPIGAIGAFWATRHQATDDQLAALEVVADGASQALGNTALGRELALALESDRQSRLTAADAQAAEGVVRERLQLALAVGEIGTWDYNPVSGEVIWDARCRELFGLRPTTPVTYARFLSMVHPEDRASVQDGAERALREGGEYHGEFRAIRVSDGGERWVASRARALLDGVGGRAVRFIGTVIDITDAKARERQLEQAIRLREEFVGVAGHELRTPLTSLQLEVQGLLRHQEATGGLAPSERMAERLRRIERQVMRMTTLIDELFDISRMSAAGRLDLVLGNVDLGTLVEENTDRFVERAQRSGTRMIVAVRKPVMVMCDRRRIDQVVANLLDNAIKYGRGKPVTISLKTDRERAYVVVRDEGIGISPQDQGRIFGRFERGRVEHHPGGFGLGLWISRRLVEAHGGTLDFTSVVDVGTTFCMTLPLQTTLPNHQN